MDLGFIAIWPCKAKEIKFKFSYQWYTRHLNSPCTHGRIYRIGKTICILYNSILKYLWKKTSLSLNKILVKNVFVIYLECFVYLWGYLTNNWFPYKLENFAGKSYWDDRFFYAENTGKGQLLFKFTISSKKQIKDCLPRMNNFSDQVTSKRMK